MTALLIQFPYGGKHVRQIPISVPQAQAEPLRQMSSDSYLDSYRLSPALTVGSEMLKLACEALIFGTFCLALTMFIYTVL